jgi:hypothetical protein
LSLVNEAWLLAGIRTQELKDHSEPKPTASTSRNSYSVI